LAAAYAQQIGASLLTDAATGEQAYLGFLVCRVVLGFFEAGHWPCALVTTQTILTRSDRSFGNSILQSGAAIGAIVTPIIVELVRTEEPGGWRPPFRVIGCIGLIWILPWLIMVRTADLDRRAPEEETAAAAHEQPGLSPTDFWRMFAVLVVVVLAINL